MQKNKVDYYFDLEIIQFIDFFIQVNLSGILGAFNRF